MPGASLFASTITHSGIDAMHGKKLKSRQRMIVEQPLPPSLAQAFAEIDADDRRRRRERPLNGHSFDALKAQDKL